jgi:hypothetical protein
MSQIALTGGLQAGQAKQVMRAGIKLHRGVYFIPDPHGKAPSLADRARAALLVCPPGSVVCGITVLGLAGVRMPEGMATASDGPVHVLIPPGSRHRPRRLGLVVHEERTMPPTFHSDRTGITAAALGHCWAQVAAELAPGTTPAYRPENDPAMLGNFLDGRKLALLQTVQLGDGLMRRKDPLIRPDQFAAQVDRLVGARRQSGVREAFKLVRPGTDSPNETWTRLVVIDAGFPEPAVNHQFKLARRGGYLDLSWPERLIALEYHGGQHFDDSTQSRDDLQRRGQLQAAGWVIVEAVYRDLLHPGDLIGRLTAAFSGRAA